MENRQPVNAGPDCPVFHRRLSVLHCRFARISMKGDELADRLLDIAVRIMTLSVGLKKTQAGRHVAGQIVKAGTSVGAHYEEARGAESRSDFVHKLGIALKECRETRYWLRVIDRGNLTLVEPSLELLTEADALCAILGQCILTAKRSGPKQ
jgi:four helix bundle protein